MLHTEPLFDKFHVLKSMLHTEPLFDKFHVLKSMLQSNNLLHFISDPNV